MYILGHVKTYNKMSKWQATQVVPSEIYYHCSIPDGQSHLFAGLAGDCQVYYGLVVGIQVANPTQVKAFRAVAVVEVSQDGYRPT